jgi:hypothetical protein
MTIEGNEGTERFFHSTTSSAAEDILATGFRDAEGHYGLHTRCGCAACGLRRIPSMRTKAQGQASHF